MKLIKNIITGTILTGLAFGMVGCDVKTNKENTNTAGYTVEHVQTEQGEFECLWYAKNQKYGAMDCEKVQK